METARGSATAPPRGTAPLAYFWGDDAYGLDAALDAFRTDARRFPDGPPERWRPDAERTDPARLLGEIRERLATGTMFGSGSVAVIRGAAGLVRSADQKQLFAEALASVAPGNGLAILEETASGAKEPPSKSISDAITRAGGVVAQVRAPRDDGLASWIEVRAREREIRMGPGAARELALRLGGYVREGDAKRGDQTRRAVSELEKLALRHADAGEPVTVEDVRALVSEAIPSSIWALQDAVASRSRAKSLELLGRVFETEPTPVLLTILHGRLRQLIEARDRLDRGEPAPSLARAMKLHSFVAEKLAEHAQRWRIEELEAALDGLLELDAQVKGVGGRASTEARDRLSFDLWITDVVAPA